jgi:hypothetical protein
MAVRGTPPRMGLRSERTPADFARENCYKCCIGILPRHYSTLRAGRDQGSLAGHRNFEARLYAGASTGNGDRRRNLAIGTEVGIELE